MLNRFQRIAVVAAMCAVGFQAQATTIYVDGTSPLISSYAPGSFDFGSHLPSYIGGTVGSTSAGTNLDGNRVYFYDNDFSTDDPATATPFNLLVWQFNAPKDSVRLYTHQDHYFGGPITDSFTASEVLEYSVWGCNGPTGGCTNQADWTLLSDPTGFTNLASGKPTYTFAVNDAATVFRGGSAEFGITNAYVQDFTFGTAYNYYAIRGSTIAMVANTADPELDAMVAFNRIDVPVPGNGSIPEPGTVLLMGVGLAGLAASRRRKMI